MTLSNIEIIYNNQPTPSIILNTDFPYFTIASANTSFLETLQLERQDIVGRGLFEAFPVNPEHRDLGRKDILEAIEYVLQFKKAHQIKKHQYDLPIMGSDQLEVHYWKIDTYPLLNNAGEILYIIQSSTDITSFYVEVEEKLKAKHASLLSNDLERLEKEVLQLNSEKDASSTEVLLLYIRGIEALYPEMQCSILQIKNHRVYNWASPSLPKLYIQAIEGLEIGDHAGSCGTAAFTKKQVIVSDIANDPIWANYRDIALEYGFKACWSHPIISSEGEVMATFAMYYQKVKTPDVHELNIIERATSLLKVILENKQYAQALKETTLLMSQGQELAQFGNWSWDVQSNVVSWSDALYAICGLRKEDVELTSESYQDILHPDDKERVNIALGRLFETKVSIELEERIIRPDGEVRYFKSWKSIQCDEHGTPIKLFGASLDVTDSKKIQKDLLASESRLRSLLDTQTNYVVRLTLDGRYTYYNNKYKEDFGWIYPSVNFLGAYSTSSVSSNDLDRITEASKKCLDQPNKVFQVEINKPAKDGGIKSSIWHLIALTDSNDVPVEFQCIGIDNTDLKQAENALRINNERHTYVNMATQDAIYDWDLEKNHIQWGDAFYRVFGYPASEELFSIEKWAALVHEEDVEITNKSLNDTLNDSTLTNWNLEYRIKKENGDFAHVEENGYILRNAEGKAVRMIGVLRDITESKMAKCDLEAAKNRYRDIFHLSPQPMFVYELGSLMILDVNSAFIEHYGYSREELLAMTIRKLRTLEDVETLNKILLNEVKPGFSHTSLSRHMKKSGELIYVLTKGNSINYDGKAARIVIAVDTTDKLKAEQDLIASERRFKTLIQDGSDLISILDTDGNYLYVSPNAERIMDFAYTLTGNNAFDFIFEEDRALVMQEFALLGNQKRIELSPFRFTNGEREVRWLQTIVTDMRDDPAIEGIVVNARDVTQRMQQELKIKEHLERYNIVSKATSDTIWDTNLLTGEVRWNQGIDAIFGYKEVSGHQWWEDHVHPDDLQRILDTVAHNKKHLTSRWTNEYRFRCADGTYKFVLDRGFMMFNDSGQATRMIGAMLDITERVNYIQTIEKKNIRLREIAWTQAHLVRAPLARIMGLMNLLNDHDNDENNADLFNYLNISVHELDEIVRDVIDKSQV
ncbi:hypothetical protein ADIARSV_0452 [Arcticibacter svalbardensis MN12-7]|uniref:histidine kinase n=1 Tax=Arcticibacter svalbardensis MN12-7 TaxID=1150600 RepID=R9GX00_9SPHI|nr:PAS domain-containing protein [Arcticibacter svalbardensis]EOR96347.1 hypothetical protein ADIARSV_0452 [Arcticibacter svalbardensis MN12-7]